MLLEAEEICYQVFPIIQQHVSKYRSKYSKKTYTQPQYVMLNLLRLWWDCEYREVYKQVRNRSGIREMIGLETTPHWTCINNAFKNHSTLLYRQLNQRIQELLPTGTIAAMDASGFQRGRVSQYYTKRTGMHLKALKTTFLVDCDYGWILDCHMTTTRKYDTKIGPDLLRRMPDSIEVLVADKGYADSDFRKAIRSLGITEQIKYKEHNEADEMANAFLDERDYSRRSFVESVMFVMKEKFGEAVLSYTWHDQFKEMVGRSIAYNLDRALREGISFVFAILMLISKPRQFAAN
jgi:IS5 family transposase